VVIDHQDAAGKRMLVHAFVIGIGPGSLERALEPQRTWPQRRRENGGNPPFGHRDAETTEEFSMGRRGAERTEESR
jgi:hypothetical protein